MFDDQIEVNEFNITCWNLIFLSFHSLLGRGCFKLEGLHMRWLSISLFISAYHRDAPQDIKSGLVVSAERIIHLIKY